MKILRSLLAVLLLASTAVTAQVAPFQPNQVLTAAALNNAFANAQITAGAINGAIIGGTVPAVGHFTTLTTTSPLGPAYGGTGATNNPANTLTMTGPYSLGFTLSGATSLTLPTSGTVLTSTTSGTGTGLLVYQTSPTLITPNIGAATGTSLSVTGQLTSSVVTGTAPLSVASTTNVANLNASSLGGATFASPGPIGSTSAGTGAFTTVAASSTVTGTAYIPTGSAVPANGVYLPAANTPAVAANSQRVMQFTSNGTVVNYMSLQARETGVGPQFYANGDTAMNFGNGGALGTNFASNITTTPLTQFQILHTAGVTRNLTVTGSNGGNPTLSATAGGIALGAALVPSTTLGIVGTTAADLVNAGSVGEVISASLAVGSATSLVTATAKTITSISLTAGDWDCTGIVDFIPAATTNVTALLAGSSTTNNAMGADDTYSSQVFLTAGQVSTNGHYRQPIPLQRINISSTTTTYLVAQATFTVSTVTAYGTIRCRRMR